jgi:tetratricopeptide (TPR) repeat protein
LPEQVRQEALAVAGRLTENPAALNQASRAVARRPGAEPSAYDLALRQAEGACRLLPFEGSYHTTLGMVQYRLGKYADALATLTRAAELHEAASGQLDPADLAFLAMTHFRLDQRDQAKQILSALREAMQLPNKNPSQESQELFREAETLLNDQSKHSL